MEQTPVNALSHKKHTVARILALLALLFILINSATYFISYHNTSFRIFGSFGIQAYLQDYDGYSIMPVGATFTLPSISTLLLTILTLLPFVFAAIYVFKRSESSALLGTVFALILASSVFSFVLMLLYSVMLAISSAIPTLMSVVMCIISMIFSFGTHKKKGVAIAAIILHLSFSVISLISLSILTVGDLIADGKALYVITVPAGSLAVTLMCVALLLKIRTVRSY